MLPPAAKNGRRGGSILSAFRLLAGIALATAPLVLSAATTAERQIHQAVEQHLQQELRQEAARQGWQGASLTHDTSLLGNTSGLPACSAPLQLTPAGRAESILDRQRYEIRCPTSGGWTVTAVTQPAVFLPAVHARGIIERGQVISRDDLKLEPVNISRARRGFYNRVEEVAGSLAARRIRANQLLTPALVASLPAVRRGESVKIVASRDGIEASTAGEALSDGQIGELIRVRNVSSDKIIDAKVIEPGVVSSTF